MTHEQVNGIINNIPIEKMVSSPLLAADKAQSQLMAQFVDKVSINTSSSIHIPTADSGKNASATRDIQAPFLALTGVPNMAIEPVNVSFELDVSATKDAKSTDNETSAPYKEWYSPAEARTKFADPVSRSGEHTRHTDTHTKYEVNIDASKQPPPETFMKILDATANISTKQSVNQVTDNIASDNYDASNDKTKPAPTSVK